MKPLPNPSVALFGSDGTATRFLTATLGNPPGVNPALVDDQGRATQVFRQYLGSIATMPLPSAETPLADADGKPTREFTRLLASLP